MTASDRTQTAYHEAGHAVAAYQLGRPFKYVSIIRDAWTLGRVEGYRPRADRSVGDMFPDARLRRWVEERVIVNLAGFGAEEAFVGHAIDPVGSEEDFHRAANYASAIEMSNDAMSAYLTWLQIRARDLITWPPIWLSVKAVAYALLDRERLTQADVGGVIDSAWEEERSRHPVFGEVSCDRG